MQMLALHDTSELLQPLAMAKPRIVWTLADVFLMLRRATDMTQAELADAAGIARTTVNELETGKVKSDQETLERIAGKLGVTLADVYAYRDDVNLLLSLPTSGRESVRDLALGLRPASEQSSPDDQH